MLHKTVRPDAKGRVTLGVLTEGVSSYLVTVTTDHKIILEPYAEIPAHEKWLFENKVALNKVRKGLEDAAEGRVSTKGSFLEFMDEEI